MIVVGCPFFCCYTSTINHLFKPQDDDAYVTSVREVIVNVVRKWNLDEAWAIHDSHFIHIVLMF